MKNLDDGSDVGPNLDAMGDVDELEDLLSRPQAPTVEALRAAPGDLLILGAGGKMGPTLARMARRAADAAGDSRRVIAVSRFSDPASLAALHAAGVETIAGDLLDARFVDSLPLCPNVVYMVGLKFGTSESAGATWVTNAYLPGVVCRRFAESRIVAFSTGNVYPFVPIGSGGSRETDSLEPVGEYGMSAVARERLFTYFSETQSTPVAVLRLNYAVEMRYGVLVDLARQIERGATISLAMGYFNCIWQGDANESALRSLPLAASPPLVLNLTGPELLACQDVSLQLARHMGRPAAFCEEPSPNALLSDSRAACEQLGRPSVSAEQLIAWTAEWISRGGPTWDRPTHFEVRDGKF